MPVIGVSVVGRCGLPRRAIDEAAETLGKRLLESALTIDANGRVREEQATGKIPLPIIMQRILRLKRARTMAEDYQGGW